MSTILSILIPIAYVIIGLFVGRAVHRESGTSIPESTIASALWPAVLVYNAVMWFFERPTKESKAKDLEHEALNERAKLIVFWRKQWVQAGSPEDMRLAMENLAALDAELDSRTRENRQQWLEDTGQVPSKNVNQRALDRLYAHAQDHLSAEEVLGDLDKFRALPEDPPIDDVLARADKAMLEARSLINEMPENF